MTTPPNPVTDEAVRRYKGALQRRGCPWWLDSGAIEMWLIYEDLREPILEECRRIRKVDMRASPVQ